jgi:hypothetical protein
MHTLARRCVFWRRNQAVFDAYGRWRGSGAKILQKLMVCQCRAPALGYNPSPIPPQWGRSLRALNESGGGVIPQSTKDVLGRTLRLTAEYKFR